MSRFTWTSGVLVALFALPAHTVAQQSAPARQAAPATLEQRAETARTAKEHLAVANAYRDRAEEFEAKAKSHEDAASRLDKARQPLEHKWPATIRRPSSRERQQAIEARRAAAESFQIAAHHLRLSLAALVNASGPTSAGDDSGS